MNQALGVAAVLLMTLLSGLMDARGFVYAARAWPGGRIDARWALASMLAFAVGLTLYIVSVRFMQNVGVLSVALQTAIWFVATAIGVAVMDGSLLQWTRAQQLVGIAIVAALGWLVATTSAHSH
jgi:hypothetical protein